jgi:hypothetical protein
VADSSDKVALADVYAGDTGKDRSVPDADTGTFRFLIETDADADAFGRVANLFTIANVAPQCVRIERLGFERLSFCVDISGISGTTADSIRRKLAQLTPVTSVELCALHSCPAP